MAENSKIEWTDRQLLAGRPQFEPVLMNDDVTRLAQSNAVLRVKPARSVVRESADVVGVKIPASIIAAMPTGKPIPLENGATPYGILELSPRVEVAGLRAVLPRVMFCPARRALAHLLRDACSRLRRVLCAQPETIALLGSTHGRTRFVSVAMAFEVAGAALRTLPHLHAGAVQAPRRKPVSSRSISVKLPAKLPLFAAGASLLSGRKLVPVFLQADPCPCGSNLLDTKS